MNDQQAREFLEMLAVPERTGAPPCPLCNTGHALETRCESAPPALASLRQVPARTVAVGGYGGHLAAAPAYLAA